MRAGVQWLSVAVVMVSSAVAAEPAVDSITVASAQALASQALPLADDPHGERAQRPTSRGDTVFTVVLGGDLGFGGSGQPVIPTGALRYGQKTPWSELTAGIAPLFNGDINFANLETVVTDRNDLRANVKSFNFKSHPAGLAHLAQLGLNVVSTANNHAIDYGEHGVRETLRHLGSAAAHGLAAWPGIGQGREHASRPADVIVNGIRVRVSAIGIGGDTLPAEESDASRQRAGMLSYNRAEDFNETVARLADAEGDLRILSVHYGEELQVRAGQSDVAKLRDQAAKAAGIDIVVGHHAHVAAGVQLVNGRLVFYGLGNLLHPGMQDMARFDLCRDYGLVARVHYTPDARGGLVLRAVEVLALTDMHDRAKPRVGDSLGNRSAYVWQFRANRALIGKNVWCAASGSEIPKPTSTQSIKTCTALRASGSAIKGIASTFPLSAALIGPG